MPLLFAATTTVAHLSRLFHDLIAQDGVGGHDASLSVHVCAPAAKVDLPIKLGGMSIAGPIEVIFLKVDAMALVADLVPVKELVFHLFLQIENVGFSHFQFKIYLVDFLFEYFIVV